MGAALDTQFQVDDYRPQLDWMRRWKSGNGCEVSA
jgi:hypothetical protein